MEIKIMKKEIGKPLVIENMEHSLENMQSIVGGYIECVRFPLDIDMWINESGLIEELPLNIVTFVSETNEIIHHIVGDVFFASHDDEGETISLNENQILWIMDNIKIVGEITDQESGKDYFVYGFAF